METALLIVIGDFDLKNIALIKERVEEGLHAWSQLETKNYVNRYLQNMARNDAFIEIMEEHGCVVRYEERTFCAEVVIFPTIEFLNQVLHAFFTTQAKRKFIVHAGPAYQGSGAWIFHDGIFSIRDFAKSLSRCDSAQDNNPGNSGFQLTVSCIAEGEWSSNGIKSQESLKRFNVNIKEKSSATCDLPDVSSFLRFICRQINYSCAMHESIGRQKNKIVGSMNFIRPTLYIFPAGQGQCCLWGVNGFSLLLDGGFVRHARFYDFLNHISNIDSLICTGPAAGACRGLESYVSRLITGGQTNPKIGHCFANRVAKPALTQEKERHSLLVPLFEKYDQMLSTMTSLNLEPQPLIGNINLKTKSFDVVTLYKKVGIGRLDMYILNPIKHTKELEDFTTSWKKIVASQNLQPSARPIPHVSQVSPLQHACSAVVLLVWHPFQALQPISRFLYCGDCPQDKILQSFERLKHLDFIRIPNPSIKPSSGAALGKKSLTVVSLKNPNITPPKKITNNPTNCSKTQTNTHVVKGNEKNQEVTENDKDSLNDKNGCNENFKSPVPCIEEQAGHYPTPHPKTGRYSELRLSSNVVAARNLTGIFARELPRSSYKDSDEIKADVKEDSPDSRDSSDESKTVNSSNSVCIKLSAQNLDEINKETKTNQTDKSIPKGASKNGQKANDKIAKHNGRPLFSKPMPKMNEAKSRKFTSHNSSSSSSLSPVSYVDIAFLPQHGYTLEFIRKIRSRYYILSSVQPTRELLDAWLQGKISWHRPDMHSTLIPTYDNDTLNLWKDSKSDDLHYENCEVTPSCSRCVLNIDEDGKPESEFKRDTCAVYRLQL